MELYNSAGFTAEGEYFGNFVVLDNLYVKASLKRVVAFEQLRAWVIQGKEWRKTLPPA